MSSIEELSTKSNKQKRQTLISLEKPIHQLFEEEVAKNPQAVAVVYEQQQLTYGELNERANRLASYLRQLGVTTETLVGLCINRSIDLVVGLMGILKSGGAYLPMDPDYPTDRLAFMLEDGDPLLLLTEEELSNRFSSYSKPIVKIDKDWPLISQHLGNNYPVNITVENLIYMIYTSGSTGRPKGAKLIHRGVINYLQFMARDVGFNHEDVFLALASISFDMSIPEILLPLVIGARTVIGSRRLAKDAVLLKEKLETKITFLMAPPATWRMVLEAGWQGNKGLCIMSAGEALPRDLANRLLDKGASFWNQYGPTECSVVSVSYQVTGESGGVVPIGKPVPNTYTLILNSQNQEVPLGELGELIIGGFGVGRGYHNRPELNAEKFVANPLTGDEKDRCYRTGDLARYLDDGNIEFLGRLDHQVKIGGYRIELEEIEVALRNEPRVQNSVVVVDEDQSDNKRLVAYLEFKELNSTLTGKILDHKSSSEIRTFLKQSLAEFMVPALYVVLSALPLSPNGKIDRRALPPVNSLEVVSEKVTVNPRDALEYQLCQLFSEILNIPIDLVDLETSFFDLGGGSITSIRLVNEIENRFHFQLPLYSLYQYPTVAAIAKHLTEKNNFLPLSPIVIIQPGDKDRVPFFCIHGAGGVIFHYYNLSHEVGDDQPFYAIQDPCLVDPNKELYASLTEMASDYIKAIKSIRPHGPYMIGGHSYGGVVSYEITQQLLNQGDEVILLAPFDSLLLEERRTFKQHLVWLKKEVKLRYEVTKYILPYIFDNIYLVLKSRKSIKDRYGKEASTSAWDSFWGNALLNYFQRKADISKVLDQNSTQYFNQQPTMRRAAKLASHHITLESKYNPKGRYSGIVKLFRATEDSAATAGRRDATLGWEKFTDNIENVWIEGSNHHNMLRKPYIEEFGRKLRAEIDKVVSTIKGRG